MIRGTYLGRHMFSFLKEQTTRPPLFSAYTAEELWTDPHVAKQMLSFHLDPDQGLASRTHQFIQRSVSWLVETFNLSSGGHVLDLGCGPGLYANPLARLGAQVTAVDFSVNSLAHARSAAEASALNVDFQQANYLHLELDGLFDLILLIFGDFCPLSPVQRGTLLDKVSGWLAPGGRFVFDVSSTAQCDSVEEVSDFEWAPEGGFWAPDPYFLFTNRFKYPEEDAYLDRYAIVEANRQREIFNWIQCFDQGRLTAELSEAGWEVEEFPGNLAGDPFDPDSTEFGVIARPV